MFLFGCGRLGLQEFNVNLIRWLQEAAIDGAPCSYNAAAAPADCFVLLAATSRRTRFCIFQEAVSDFAAATTLGCQAVLTTRILQRLPSEQVPELRRR